MHLSYTRTPHVSPSAFLYAIVIFLFAIFPQEAEAKSYLIHISSSIVGLIVLAVDLVAICEYPSPVLVAILLQSLTAPLQLKC